MKTPKLDMHIHSRLSDGERINKEIIEESKRLGLDFVAVSDHDSLNKDFPVEAKKSSIDSCEAVEISVRGHQDKEAHLIAYSKEFNNSILRILNSTKESRIGILENKIDRLCDRTIRINLEEFYEYFEDQGVNKEFITILDLAKYVYKDKRYVSLIHDVFGNDVDYRKFASDFLDEDGENGIIGGMFKCLFLPNIEEVRRNLNMNNTVLSLAHPQLLFRNTHEMREKIPYYINRGVNAIEINSVAPKNWVHAILNVREQFNLMLTVGSDNHSKTITEDEHDKIGAINYEISDNILKENFAIFKNIIKGR